MTEIDLSQFNEECIEQHNFLRSLHGCQPVSYDPIIAQNAQAYAEELAKRDVMEHSEDIPYGENLAYSNKGANGIYKAYDVANSWYGEIEDYDFNSNEEQMDCGHFSQLVWRDTVRAGFGYAKNPTTHNIYVVGQYDPPGNFYGQWADNIPPPIDGTIWRPPPVTDRDIDLNVPEFDFGLEVNNFGSELDIYDRPESHPDSHEYENITKRHSITSIKYKKMYSDRYGIQLSQSSSLLIEPQEGNPIRLQPIKANNNILSRRSEVKLRQIAPLINRGDRIDQENVFAALGITLDRNQRLIRVKFIEHGCSYVDPESDRSKASDISSEDGFDMAIPQQKQVDFPIFYHVMVEKPFIHDGVNFFGRIEFESPIEEKEWRTVFMTGKGTVALEGRDNDCHAGYCTGPACASFQQRVAIILSAILALGASPDSQEIEDIRNHFRRINYHYHGRDHILEYTMDRCLGRINNDLSYLDYMRQIYAQDDDPMPKMLEHFLNFDLAPHENYYVKMKGKFKDEEVQEELKHFETHQQLMDKYLKMEIGEIPLKDFNEENFRDEILDAHNDMRRRHGAKPLKRNEELDRKAQEWAEYLYQKGLFVRNNFKYRNEPVGDSISVLVKNTDLDNPRRFVENWYEERKFYDYDIEPKTINDIRNFTQIVWQDTEELGSGAIGDESGRTYVVCLYWPAGNIRGQFLNNVTETKY